MVSRQKKLEDTCMCLKDHTPTVGGEEKKQKLPVFKLNVSERAERSALHSIFVRLLHVILLSSIILLCGDYTQYLLLAPSLASHPTSINIIITS